MKCNRIGSMLCALFLISNMQISLATVLAQGNNTNANLLTTFTDPILAKAFDHPSSYFFVSLAVPTGGTDPLFAIARATRTFGVDTPVFENITPTTFTTTFNLLSLATSRGNTKPNLALVATPSSPTTLQQQVSIISNDGQKDFTSASLLDATSAENVDGSVTEGITNITANQAFILAALIPSNSSSTTTYGAAQSGIGVVAITTANDTLSLQQTAAVAGDSGIKAITLDATTPELFIDGLITINPNNRSQPYPLMIWDDILQRFYIGFDVQTDNTVSELSGSRSIVAASVSNPAGIATLIPIAPGSAFVTGNETNIVGFQFMVDCPPEYCYPSNCDDPDCNPDGYYLPDGCDPDDPSCIFYPSDCYPPGCDPEPYCVTPDCPPVNLSVHRIATLHASTGPSYLIVNGGNGSSIETGNLIYALPLVDSAEQPAIHGTLANKNSALINGKFVVPALINADLVTNTDPAAMVGAGPFPFDPDNEISDLIVIGDTVYASSNEPQSSVDDVGIFYSQAMFDETGKIIRWTPWTKRSFPYNGFPNNSPQVAMFEVDAESAEVWAVNGRDQTTVCISAWDRGTSPISLVAQLNNALGCNGSYAVLDLDQSTRGFLGNTCSRYALFGGINQVFFAQVSQARISAYCDEITNPQRVMTDYTDPDNFLSTSIPGCEAVTVLEYSRRGAPYETLGNYFYAGTQNGLYVFASSQGNALDVSTFGDLDTPPFSTGRWSHIASIPGAVIDIKTTGNMLYVLALNSTPTAPLQGTVYRIPFQPTINAMFDPSNILAIAQTRTAPTFDSILRFLGMQIISTQSDGSTEQLVLATNHGLFKSSRAGGVQNATNQTDAAWQHISDSGNNFYIGIGGMHSSIPIAPPSTVWPFNLQDPTNLKLFNRASINQLNGTNDAGPFSFVPSFFNSIETTNLNFKTLDPITYFWSDGARRFFIVNPAAKNCVNNVFNKLLTLPFDTIDWNVARPAQDINFDATLTTVQSFNWVEDIGATGIIIAGTNKGVVALE